MKNNWPQIFMPVQNKTDPGSVPSRSVPYRFIKGPLPLDWMAACGRLPGRALHVGLCLWYLHGLRKEVSVVCSYRVLAEFGVKRHAAYRALKALEQAGLISVIRGPGKSPRVTLLQVRPDSHLYVNRNPV
ncbi:MAG TPA: hypothetical protein VKB81_07335 [Nitrospira sp.]|nr:hypothetical protein [Nitrospira sp.]